MEIPERDWLTVGFIFMALGFLATMPPIGGFVAGDTGAMGLQFDDRRAYRRGVLQHDSDAARRTRSQSWFWRTLFLGYFSIRKLQSIRVPPNAAQRRRSRTQN